MLLNNRILFLKRNLILFILNVYYNLIITFLFSGVPPVKKSIFTLKPDDKLENKNIKNGY